MEYDLDFSIVKYVMNKYYKKYLIRHYEDLLSYGLQALWEANLVYNKETATKPFKYFAVCLIRRAMYTFVRDKITKTYQNTQCMSNEFLYNSQFDEINVANLDLYRAISTLSEQEKEILYLMYHQDYTLYKIADNYGWCYHTALRHHKGILKKLKELLK